ncbi:MAG: YihY/virulence factor BrkB family protein [Burkholderiaceae bacterium]
MPDSLPDAESLVRRLSARGARRGHDAHSPVSMPWRGWWDILRRVTGQIEADRVPLVAAGVTYYLLLSLVPALTALVSVYGLFSDPSAVQQQLTLLRPFLPADALAILEAELLRLATQADATLGVAASLAIGIALWSANSGMKAVIQALNIAYGETEKRGYLRLTLISLVFTLGTVVLAITLIALLVAIPLLAQALGLGEQAGTVSRLGGAVLLAAGTVFGLAAIYRWGPSRVAARFRWITPGAGIAVLICVLASLAFSWYVASFQSFNKTYGSLGAIIMLMTWVWILITVVIMGAEFNAETERQTLRDSTKGPDRPIGQRGAVVADDIAPVHRGG